MRAVEWMMIIVFVVPIVMTCIGFVLAVTHMQWEADRLSAQKRGYV